MKTEQIPRPNNKTKSKPRWIRPFKIFYLTLYNLGAALIAWANLAAFQQWGARAFMLDGRHLASIQVIGITSGIVITFAFALDYTVVKKGIDHVVKTKWDDPGRPAA